MTSSLKRALGPWQFFSFAFGSIGDANGHAAIMIDHIEKGTDHD